MKTFKLIILSALSSFFVLSCSKEYDDSELWDKVNSLEDRIESIEEKIESMNKEIASVENIVKRSGISALPPIPSVLLFFSFKCTVKKTSFRIIDAECTAIWK